jgi:hypothetical protein
MRVNVRVVPWLLVLGFVGGWYLIPADVAWLLIEFTDTRGRKGVPRTAAS